MKQLDANMSVFDRFCNKCGMSCRDASSEPNRVSFNGLIAGSVVGSYLSTHVRDGDVYEFDLCEGCFLSISKDFKYPPWVGNYLNPNHAKPGFDRHAYMKDDRILWEDLSEEEKTVIKSKGNLFSKWFDEAPRDELVLYLYELENGEQDQRESEPDKDELIKKIKEVLAQHRHKNYGY